MSLAAFYEASVLSALTDILSYVQPPPIQSQRSSATDHRSGSGSAKQQQPSPLVSIRWPSLPASRQQLLDALTLHDLLVLLIHAAILQHGATPIPQQSEQPPAAAATPAAAAEQATSDASLSRYQRFISTGWNSSRSGYRLRYVFSTPSSHSVDSTEAATAYELRLLLLPMSHYLVIDANMQQQGAVVDGASSAVSSNHRLTLDVLNYVSLDELYGCLTRWQDGVRGQQQQAQQPASGESSPLQLSAWVYRDVALLLTAVSNALIKRCMGPLSAHSAHSLIATSTCHQLTHSWPAHTAVLCLSVVWPLLSWSSFFAPNSVEDRLLPPSLPLLPVDLLLSVLLYLPSVDLARIGAVSAAMNAAACSPLLWQWLCSVELDMSDRSLVAKDDWKSEFVIRRQRRREELYRNRFALVPVGLPVDVRDDRRLGVGGVRGERPFFRLPFPLQPHALDDPLRFREWRRNGFGGWGGGGYRMS